MEVLESLSMVLEQPKETFESYYYMNKHLKYRIEYSVINRRVYALVKCLLACWWGCVDITLVETHFVEKS